MDRRKQCLYGSLSAIAVLLLILDSKTAFSGANEGLTLCINTLIPSLFPFLIFTSIITSVFVGNRIKGFGAIARSLGIPSGAESLLVLGVLGGYPVGAQAVYDAYKAGQIEKDTARRLLGFCSNAGPAFIFGIVGSLFSKPVMAWIIWGIHILSAYLTGLILHGKSNGNCRLNGAPPISFPQAMHNSIRTMAAICGWVIIFRMIAGFLKRWVLWILPAEVSVSILGILELANGCIALRDISSEGMKLVISCGLLSFGGLCVWMQTVSVTKELGTGMYLPGKLLQSCISILLAGVIQTFISHTSEASVLAPVYICAACILGLLVIWNRNEKKVVALWG